MRSVTECRTISRRLPAPMFVLLTALTLAAPLVAENRRGGGQGGAGGSDPAAAGQIRPAATYDDNAASGANRVMVLLNRGVTQELLAELLQNGVVHGWVERYRLVSMTLNGSDRDAVRRLAFVDSVETDSPVFADSAGTWDRDLIDVTDVEETGIIGDPDSREVRETGAGVHVAVIDSGLVPDWRDFLPEDRVDTSLARAITGGPQAVIPVSNTYDQPTELWERDTCAHGTAVASHVIGFNAGGVRVDGAAPGVTVIPIKVLFESGSSCSAFTSQIIAGIDYVTRLVEAGTIGRTVINMSLGGPSPSPAEARAIDDAIAAGIIVVASAGNRGERGMGWPGAFPQVISAGAIGWTRQFQPGTDSAPNTRFWWTQDVAFDPDRGRASEAEEVFVAGFSSRAIPSLVAGFPQELDVMAPGQSTVAPFPAPSSGGQSSGLFFINGTSFSAPLTAGAAALLLEKDPTLGQADVEAILKSSALPISPAGVAPGVVLAGDVSWDGDCGGVFCDPVGSGLLQVDDALAAASRPGR